MTIFVGIGRATELKNSQFEFEHKLKIPETELEEA